MQREIERVVREHLVASERAAAVAVERAFLVSASPPTSRRSGATSKTTTVRRTSTEIAMLGERLYETVCAHPGVTMKALIAQLGGSARELHRPMTLLKRQGRIRSVGQRNQTRYFPMVSGNASKTC